jgi:DNA-binding NtrC family response regulator
MHGSLPVEPPDAVLVTSIPAEVTPVELLEHLLGATEAAPVIFWYPELTAAEAVRLVRHGAAGCFCSRTTPQEIEDCLERAIEINDAIRGAGHTEEPWKKMLVGESRAMRDIDGLIRLVSARRCTVLISGETGTGKEMVARAIHAASPRGGMPMVSVNCSALPEHLLEAELFGHIKGAFTGAIANRVGRFEQAHRSTIFLDEIGEMPMELQAKLLRVLQEREIQRLGSSETIRVDVRVIAASNANLLELTRSGKFREDLYYRLNVVPVHVPPLRQRQGDIALLAHHFAEKICRLEGIPTKRLAPEAVERLSASSWPGNVRQLENSMEMAIALSGDREILTPSDFGLATAPKMRLIPFQTPADAIERNCMSNFTDAVTQFERSILEQALTKSGGNKTAAAEMLGLKRTTLIMKLRSLGAAPATAGCVS